MAEAAAAIEAAAATEAAAAASAAAIEAPAAASVPQAIYSYCWFSIPQQYSIKSSYAVLCAREKQAT